MINLNNSDYEKSREEVDKLLYNMRIDLTNSRKNWKGKIIGKEVTEIDMEGKISKFIQKKLDHVNLIFSVKTGRSSDWVGIKKLIGARGGEVDTQMEDCANQYLILLNQLNAMPRKTWDQQIAICDVIEAEVVPPLLTLWDE